MRREAGPAFVLSVAVCFWVVADTRMAVWTAAVGALWALAAVVLEDGKR